MTPRYSNIRKKSSAQLGYSYRQFSHSQEVVLFFAASWWLESTCSQSVSQLHSPKRAWGETQLFRYLESWSDVLFISPVPCLPNLFCFIFGMPAKTFVKSEQGNFKLEMVVPYEETRAMVGAVQHALDKQFAMYLTRVPWKLANSQHAQDTDSILKIWFSLQIRYLHNYPSKSSTTRGGLWHRMLHITSRNANKCLTFRGPPCFHIPTPHRPSRRHPMSHVLAEMV